MSETHTQKNKNLQHSEKRGNTMAIGQNYKNHEKNCVKDIAVFCGICIGELL